MAKATHAIGNMKRHISLYCCTICTYGSKLEAKTVELKVHNFDFRTAELLKLFFSKINGPFGFPCFLQKTNSSGILQFFCILLSNSIKRFSYNNVS
jgi:hypothetical protein